LELSKKPETIGVIGKVFFMGWQRPSDQVNARNGQGKVKTERQPGAFQGKMKNHPVLVSFLQSIRP
jgi:hypothetical protein